jgi:ribosomal protein S18 acetylase RimI-like enzyme
MSEVTIVRPATHDDLDGLVLLLEALFSIEEDFAIDRTKQRLGLELMLNNGRGCILTAVAADETVVGMCSGQLTVSTAEGGPAVLIEDVVVLNEWRGQGIGAKLLDGVSAWAKDNEAVRLQLLADKNNQSALDFYKHLGWEQTQLTCLRNRL